MIPLSRIVSEIEKHASSANNQDDSVAREALVAIRALCDVALSESPKVVQYQSTRQIEVPMIRQTESPSLRPAEPLKEDGANGDSLFDF
ncbi:MAG: YwdI family protein [Planococcaceae bacterium]|nr:YwdI family protein [Bacillota bacterium]MDX1770468.1 YwdI family protein [Planococcaceae bacterium]